MAFIKLKTIKKSHRNDLFRHRIYVEALLPRYILP